MNRGGRKTYDVDQIVTTSNSSLRESSSVLELEFFRASKCEFAKYFCKYDN